MSDDAESDADALRHVATCREREAPVGDAGLLLGIARRIEARDAELARLRPLRADDEWPAVPEDDADILRAVADWLDSRDARRVPIFGPAGDSVQRDIRRVADRLERLETVFAAAGDPEFVAAIPFHRFMLAAGMSASPDEARAREWGRSLEAIDRFLAAVDAAGDAIDDKIDARHRGDGAT